MSHRTSGKRASSRYQRHFGVEQRATGTRCVRVVSSPAAGLARNNIVTLAEVLYGLELLPHGRRRERLSELSRIIFEIALRGRILAFDAYAAPHYARMRAAKRQQGLTMSPQDAQIAAIAFTAGASVATRNVTDFDQCGVTVINPWSA